MQYSTQGSTFIIQWNVCLPVGKDLQPFQAQFLSQFCQSDSQECTLKSDKKSSKEIIYDAILCQRKYK